MRTMNASFAALALVLAVGCGSAPSSQNSGDASELRYLTFGNGTVGLVAHAKQTSIKACLFGADSSNQGEWAANIKSVIGKWVGTMTALTSDTLTSQVEVLVNGRDCDVDVSVESGAWSQTNVGDHPTVHMGASGYFAGYNVLLHEFGHAFALGDTYMNGQSGNCQPGQPQAVMCNTSFDEPQPDDIKGIKDIYSNAFPNDKPGQPGIPGRPAGSKYSLAAALGKDLGNGNYVLKIGVSGAAEAPGGVVEICEGNKNQCMSSGFWASARRETAKNGATIFTIASQAVASGQELTLRYLYAGTADYQNVEFR